MTSQSGEWAAFGKGFAAIPPPPRPQDRPLTAAPDPAESDEVAEHPTEVDAGDVADSETETVDQAAAEHLAQARARLEGPVVVAVPSSTEETSAEAPQPVVPAERAPSRQATRTA